MIRLAVCLALLFAAPLAAQTGSAQTDTAAATANEVRDADIAFARRAQEIGPAAAFREYMDPVDGLSYGGPQPAHGADAIYQLLGGDGPAHFKLQWVPTGAWGSKGGDMGVTVGDWVRSKLDDTEPAETGRYVTVWRRDAQGAWKGLIDIGESDDTPQPNAANKP